jgi:PIN domain nuclease of toxin-antitoxin system
VIVLDTHVWVWWVSGSEPLSRTADEAIKTGMAEGTLLVSSISNWEVAQLVERGRLELTMDVADWIAKSESLRFLNFVPVDNRIAVRSTRLPGSLHRDPADRIIVSTAQVLGAGLVTRDERLRKYAHVETIW